MAKYEKWLGAGLGWIVSGNPLGGLLGFLAGTMIEQGSKDKPGATTSGVSEFEVNLIVLASHLIKVDGKVSLDEISFVQNFLNAHFDEKYADKRSQILSHCLNKEYDLNAACGQIRSYTQHGTKTQVVHFLFDLAACDGALNERESYFIFKVAGFLNVNDVDFKKIKTEHFEYGASAYEILGAKREMSFTEIRGIYRKLVLKYHPDRNKNASEEEKKKLARKFQQIQESYERIKSEREKK